VLYVLNFGFRFRLRQHELTEFKKTNSVCDPDDTTDRVPSLKKPEMADVQSTAAHSAKLNRQQKEDDVKDTPLNSSKGGVVIFRGYEISALNSGFFSQLHLMFAAAFVAWPNYGALSVYYKVSLCKMQFKSKQLIKHL